MGTRADFYIGCGDSAEWLGSVAWDGYEWEDEDSCLMKASTAEAFRAAVAEIKKKRDDFTDPSEGWPWPWKDSCTTDLAYVLHEGKVKTYHFGRETFVNEDGEIDSREEKESWFPKMDTRSFARAGSHKSGIIVVSAK